MRLPALEKNILKYRALEMTIILFHAESLKRFIIDSIRATEDLHEKIDKRPHRLPIGTKKVLGKAFDILVQDEILSQEESNEMQDLIVYRNEITHRIHQLTADIVHPEEPGDRLKRLEVKYRYDALGKFEQYRSKIERGLQANYILSLSLENVFFENAEQTYKEELRRLRKKITRQFESRKRQIECQKNKALKKRGNITEPGQSL